MTTELNTKKSWRENRLAYTVRDYEEMQGRYESVIIHLIGALVFFFALLVAVMVLPGRAHAYTNKQLATAIFYAEGGNRAVFKYGIRSVRYSSIKEARKICLNTIRNNKRRWIKSGKKVDFITFLGSRYCPTSGCFLSCSERKLNKHWISNVNKFLAREVSRG